MSARRPEFAMVFFHRWLNSPQIAKMPWDAQGYVWHLMCRAYADGDCAIPDDDDLLAKWAYMTREEWNASAMRRHVRGYFLPIADAPGKLANRTQRDLHAASVESMQKASDIGKAGAKKRWGSAESPEKHDSDAEAMPRHMPTQCQPNATRNAEGKEGRKEEGKKERKEEAPQPPKGAAAEPDGFAAFWDAYPATFRKTERKKTAARFAAIIKAGGTVEQIMAGLGRWLESKQWADRHANNGEFIAAPEVFLGTEKHQWNLYPPPAKALPNGGVVDEYPEL